MINNQKVIVVLPAYNAAKTLKITYDEIDFDLVDDIEEIECRIRNQYSGIGINDAHNSKEYEKGVDKNIVVKFSTYCI